MDMTAVSATTNSLNLALNITKTLFGIRDQAMVQEKVVELTSQIMNAQQATMAAVAAQLSLESCVRELEAELVHMKHWETEKQRYELKQVSQFGTFARVLKPNMATTEPMHAVCAACYDKGRKSIMQGTSKVEFRRRVHICPECRTTIFVETEALNANPKTTAA